MRRLLGTIALFCAAGMLPALAQDAKDKAEIKGGIDGQVKKIDVDKATITITLENGRDRTFTITDDTTMLGPRGGVVRKRLKDPRFHEGLEITVVASGNEATELHLGVDRSEPDDTKTKTATRPGDKEPPFDPTKKTDAKPGDPAKKPDAKPADRKTTTPGTAKKADEEDETEEFPGKIKRVDAARHMLVISLLNGKERSFLVAGDTKILVYGTATTKGLSDPALKADAPITVITDSGGHKVKEVRLVQAKAKKAG